MTRKIIQVIKIPANRAVPMTLETVEVDNLSHLQRLVGGLIERVYLTDNIDLWVNEEGLINALDVNFRATAFSMYEGVVHPHGLRGDAFISGASDADGRMLEIPKGLIDLMVLLNGDT